MAEPVHAEVAQIPFPFACEPAPADDEHAQVVEACQFDPPPTSMGPEPCAGTVHHHAQPAVSAVAVGRFVLERGDPAGVAPLEAITACKRVAGVTLEELAGRGGITKQTLSRWLRAGGPRALQQLDQLLRSFGLRIVVTSHDGG